MRYRHITISGSICSGKGTLARNLAHYLKPKGWKFFSGSELAHSFAPQFYDPAITVNRHHHTAQYYTDEVDRAIDQKMHDMLVYESKYVIDSWISGFNAQGVPDVLKVLLVCSCLDILVDRVANRDNSSIVQAKEHIVLREKMNFSKWQRLYGTHDFHSPHIHDLTIDTYRSGPMETVGKVLDAVGYTP